MAHRLDDFVAGVVATFGSCFLHQREVDDLAQAAREFYLDLHGLPHGTMAQLPLWRYLMHASSVLVDRAASACTSSASEEHDMAIDEAELEAAATAMTSYWPFLATMVTRQYRYRHRRADPPSSPSVTPPDTARISTAEVAVQTEEPPPEERQSDTDDLAAAAAAAAAVAEEAPSSQPLGPPAMLASPAFDFAQPSPFPSPCRPHEAISNPFFSPPLAGKKAAPRSRPMLRASSSRSSSSVSTKESLRSSSHGGRTLSNSTESSIASTTGTSVQSIRSEGGTPDATSGGNSQVSAGHARGTSSLPVNGGSETPTPRASPSIQPNDTVRLQAPPLRRTKSLEPTLILSDRGDNAAKLLPTLEGSYVVQVSIGGRKLLLNPERPGEIQYHDNDGKVVTRSLVPSDEEDEAES